MINHARALLLNRSSASAPGYDFPGEEVIPIGFTELSLPAYLQHVRQELFGSDPDRAFTNFRLQQFLQLLHSTELSDYVFALDPRVTYLGRTDRVFYAGGLFLPQVQQTTGSLASLTLFGEPASPDVSGRMLHQFQLSIISDSEVELLTQTSPRSERFLDYELTDGLSQALPLGATGLSFCLPSSADGVWDVSVYLRPQWSLGVIAANLQARSGSFALDLFGPAPVEPYKTFQNLWVSHPELAYSLGGLLLAYVYRLEGVRTGADR